jgi:hypothetical protein
MRSISPKSIARAPRLANARAAWFPLQRQKRRRHSAAEPVVSGLQAGLSQFYQVVPGATHLRSWNESEIVPSYPLLGFEAPYSEGASGGSYNDQDAVVYSVMPSRDGDGRTYAGIIYSFEVLTILNDAILWPEWTDNPGWVTGFTVLRRVNDVYAGYREMSAATMFAGWTDNGAGWSSAAALPFDFNNPPNVAKVLWNRLDETTLPQLMATVSWAGGTAFNAGADRTQLVRGISEDLRRDLDGTLAFWICPMDEGRVAAVSGYSKASFRLRGGSSGSGFEFGDSGNVFVDGHQPGDWYLLVMRNNTGANTLTIDALRQRDLVQVSATQVLPDYCSTLALADNYMDEGVGSALSIGGPWFSDASVPAYFDRIGLWNRPLTNEEVLELFNNGTGWLPT